ncbi:proline-rich protein 4 [Capsicum galapagoense]
MGLQSLFSRILIAFTVSLLLFAVSFCYADDVTIQVVGIGKCADCKKSNIKTIHAFSGLRVTIDCKVGNGKFKTRGEGEVDKDGKFKASLPKEIVKDGKMKEDCYAQLHSVSAAPCPTHNGIEASKIVVTKSENNDKYTLKPSGNLKFSTALCTSTFLWPHFKFPPFPNLPPFPIFKKPFPPPIPIYKKPLLPPIPIYKKPPLPPTPIYKQPILPPIPPYNKPILPPIPIYKKPLLPPIPIYKPIPPFFKKPFPPLLPKFPQISLFPPSVPHR